jgi:hypothetical protein
VITFFKHLNMSEFKREDGHQITNALLAKSIATDKKCKVEDVVIEDFFKTKGCHKGENFASLLFAVNIKAKVKGQYEAFNYMIKCLRPNESRAKELTVDVSSSIQKRHHSPGNFFVNKSILFQVKVFDSECFFYDHLAKQYQDLRSQKGMNKLALPTVYLTNLEEGIIVMENLKTDGYTMLNRLGGERKLFMLFIWQIKIK